MKLFHCQACDQILYFENVRCERSGHTLGYLPAEFDLSALEPLETTAEGTQLWRPLAEPEASVRLCDNAQYEACNWLVAADSEEKLCAACRHNRSSHRMRRSFTWWPRPPSRTAPSCRTT